MSADKISAYKDNAVTTQSKGKIVVLLYQGAIKFLKQSLTALDNHDYLEKGRLIGRAVDILCELNAALDLEAGGEVALNLRKLYLFCHEELLKANFKKDPKPVKTVIGILEELLGGWEQVAA